MNIALPIIVLFLAFALGVGIYAKRGHQMTMEQWAVGGRGFGAILVFLLMAGETFTTFTFLGASGWSYGKGAPTFYILAYGCLAYVTSYWILPPVWRYAKERNLVSFPDFFAKKYDSKGLGILVAVLSAVGLCCLLIIQLRGLGVIVSEASYGLINASLAICGSAVVMVIYTFVSGVRGSASIAIFKDIIILVLAVFLGTYLPYHYYGGYGPMFTAIETAHPGFLRLPEEGLNLSWYNSTMLLIALGYYLYPHAFTAIYTADNEKSIRKNATLMPLYQVVLVFMFFVGFAAIEQVPGLKGPDGDLALLRLVKQTFDPWLVGIIGGAGLLTALVPGSMILLNSATLLSKNIYQEGFAPQTPPERITQIAKCLLPLFAIVVVYFTLQGGATFVTLSILASSLLTQLLPAFIGSILPKPVGNKYGAVAGILVGAVIVAFFTLSDMTLARLIPSAPSALIYMNTGLIALIANAVVFYAVSLCTHHIRLPSAEATR